MWSGELMVNVPTKNPPQERSLVEATREVLPRIRLFEALINGLDI